MISNGVGIPGKFLLFLLFFLLVFLFYFIFFTSRLGKHFFTFGLGPFYYTSGVQQSHFIYLFWVKQVWRSDRKSVV